MHRLLFSSSTPPSRVCHKVSRSQGVRAFSFQKVQAAFASYNRRSAAHSETGLGSSSPSSGGPREQPLKARFPDVYRGRNHMECYKFCQQCEDRFATAGAKGPNRIPFAASFLRDRANFSWQQHKSKLEERLPVPAETYKIGLPIWSTNKRY